MLAELTDRENQILELIAHGLSNREISFVLSICESTVENHTHHIYSKLGISNRVQAVVYAFRVKYIPINDIRENRGNPS